MSSRQFQLTYLAEVCVTGITSYSRNVLASGQFSIGLTHTWGFRGSLSRQRLRYVNRCQRLFRVTLFGGQLPPGAVQDGLHLASFRNRTKC